MKAGHLVKRGSSKSAKEGDAVGQQKGFQKCIFKTIGMIYHRHDMFNGWLGRQAHILVAK